MRLFSPPTNQPFPRHHLRATPPDVIRLTDTSPDAALPRPHATRRAGDVLICRVNLDISPIFSLLSLARATFLRAFFSRADVPIGGARGALAQLEAKLGIALASRDDGAPGARAGAVAAVAAAAMAPASKL